MVSVLLLQLWIWIPPLVGFFCAGGGRRRWTKPCTSATMMSSPSCSSTETLTARQPLQTTTRAPSRGWTACCKPVNALYAASVEQLSTLVTFTLKGDMYQLFAFSVVGRVPSAVLCFPSSPIMQHVLRVSERLMNVWTNYKISKKNTCNTKFTRYSSIL